VQNIKPDYYNSLEKTYHKICSLLEDGLANRNDTFHIPVLICGENKKYDGRIVVLRGVDLENKVLRFHSDIRSNKIKILKSNPSANFLFYNKIEKIQLRISGQVKINYKNNITKNSWGKTAHMSRQCYLGVKVPGSDSLIPTSGLSEDINNSNYSIEESEVGYNNFCVVETFIKTIEWLYLASKGHRRAKFTFKGNQIEKKWLIP
jgi:3-hydroxyisobutyrate dehydrogenase